MDEWTRQIDLYLTWLKAGGAAPDTIKVRRSYLVRLARTLDTGPGETRTPALLMWVSTHKAPESRKSARGTIRSFYAYATAADEVTFNPARTLPPVRVPRAKARPTPDITAFAALRRASDRERLMILLAMRAGLRRAEISRVRGDDLLDGDVLRITGKGGNVRIVPIFDVEILAALDKAGPGWLFPSRRGGHLSPNWIGTMLSELLGPGWTAHTLRHRMGTRAYAGTKDLRAVQELLGHASPVTTSVYVAVASDDLRAAVLAAA